MNSQLWRAITLLFFWIIFPAASAFAEGPAVTAKQWPPGFFYKYHQTPIKEKEQLLANIDATLKKLNQGKYGLIVKGAVIDAVRTDVKVYPQLTILDESGLVIIAHRVPNIYYRYPGTAGLNKNIFMVIKKARVNFPESYIRYGLVVEGDFVAYAQKYMTAIMEGLENAAREEFKQPPRPRR